jgi:uncharacterized membrane protein (DUF373 family)
MGIMTSPTTPPATTSSLTNNAFLMIEHGVYAAIGILLSIVGIVALIHVGIDVATDVLAWSENGRIFHTVDQLLFVLMLAEILHTVRVSIRSGSLNAEPFLVVGLIASIRRVLVITLASSNAQQQEGGDHAMLFRTSMIELCVLALLIMTMVISIFLIRKSARQKGSARGDVPSPPDPPSLHEI